MSRLRDPDASLVAKRILDYLARHREAADTASGIATWWLRGAEPAPLDVVDRALALLGDQGLVENQTLLDGTVIFRGTRAHHDRD